MWGSLEGGVPPQPSLEMPAALANTLTQIPDPKTVGDNNVCCFKLASLGQFVTNTWRNHGMSVGRGFAALTVEPRAKKEPSGRMGEGSQQLSTDLLLQKSQKPRFMWEVPPAPPWPDGSLLTPATETHRCTPGPRAPEPASLLAQPKVTSALAHRRHQQLRRSPCGVSSWPPSLASGIPRTVCPSPTQGPFELHHSGLPLSICHQVYNRL